MRVCGLEGLPTFELCAGAIAGGWFEAPSIHMAKLDSRVPRQSLFFSARTANKARYRRGRCAENSAFTSAKLCLACGLLSTQPLEPLERGAGAAATGAGGIGGGKPGV